MDVVFLGDSISEQIAGIHYFGRQLIQYITHRFPQHTYHMVSTKKDSDLPVNVLHVPKSKLSGVRLRQLTTIPRMLNKMKPQMVVELAHFGPFFLNAGIQRVTTIHDITPLINPSWHPWSSVLAHRALLPSIVRRVDAIITNSAFTREDLLRHFPHLRAEVHVYRPPASIPGSAAPPLLASPYLLTVGTLEPRKNHEVILEAFESIALQYPGWHLVMAGPVGWKVKALLARIHGSSFKDRIHLTGYLDRKDLANYYQYAQAFIYASRYEGLAMPLLEAMQLGIPLVLPDHPSLPPEARSAGLLFTDKTDLITKISRIARDELLRAQLGTKSLEEYKCYLDHGNGALAALFDR